MDKEKQLIRQRVEQIKRDCVDAIKYGEKLEDTFLSLDKMLAFVNSDVNSYMLMCELTMSWENDNDNMDGVTTYGNDIAFNKKGLVKNEKILIEYLGADNFEMFLNGLIDLDSEIRTYNGFIKSYRKADMKTLLWWKNAIQNEIELSIDDEIELCIVNAEIESRKLINRIKKPIGVGCDKLIEKLELCLLDLKVKRAKKITATNSLKG